MSKNGHTASERGLKVLIADEDEAALAELSACLELLGHEVIARAVRAVDAAQIIAGEDPDASIVMLHEDDEHALDLIGEAVEYANGPVIALTGTDDVEFVTRAAERGIDAHTDAVTPAAVQAALEVAIRRARDRTALSEQVDRLESALERRAVIERAKGILMERHSVADRQAFELLRDQARSRSRPVLEIATAVVEGHALLPSRSERTS